MDIRERKRSKCRSKPGSVLRFGEPLIFLDLANLEAQHRARRITKFRMNELNAAAANPPRKRRWLRQNLNYPPLILLFAIGVSLRVILMVTYFPAVMLSYDSPRYARVGPISMFSDFWMPAGYPILLKLLHSISQQLGFTIAVQHLMGLATGLMVFLVSRHLGVKPWIACLPAAVILFSGDQLYQEHSIMADWFLTFLVVGGLAAAMRGLVPELNLLWIATGNVLLTAAALTRSVGVVLLPILVICVAVWVQRFPHQRARAIAASILPGMGMFGLYFGAFKLTHGQYLGLCDMRGWNLYSRVAPFADCRKFDPPEGTRILCEERAPADRPGPFGYVWDLNSTPRQKFELGPESGRNLAVFARQAILHQPSDYIRAVLVDLAKYIKPSLNRRPYSGQPPEILSFAWRDPAVEELVVRAMSREYEGTQVYLHGRRIMKYYQNIFRIHGLLICAFGFFTVLGMVKTRGPVRLGIFLFGLSAIGLYLLPVLTVSYDFRYGIPPASLLAVSGVLGAAACWPRSGISLEWGPGSVTRSV